MTEADFIPVNEETLEWVRTRMPLAAVGRIDLRPLSDRITFDTIANARYEHRKRHIRGDEAPIRMRERQVKWLAISLGYGAKDEDGNPRDFTKPGSQIFGHELWVEPAGEGA